MHRPWQGDNFFLERMFKVEAFKERYLARLDEFSKTIFRPERLAKQVDEIAAVIRPAVLEESESELDRFDQLVAGELVSAPGPFGGSQTKPIKPFSKVRTESVMDQLASKSEGLVPGSGFGGGGGLGMFSRSFIQALDNNKDTTVTQAEFTQGFANLFQAWNSDKSGYLTLAQVRAGIEKDLPPARQGSSRFGGGPPGNQGPPPNRPRQTAPEPQQQPPMSGQR
ncbi:MAG TPA: CotH kinase family protein [Clostridia bacterium]|nr:CotH kinase family protein [Clostridia bacterium]